MTVPDRGAVPEGLRHSPVLADPLKVRPLPGGLTNHNLDVTTATGRYVARFSGPGTALLGINRAAEHHNSVLAAQAGVAPEVVDHQPEANLLVVRYLTGRTLGEADLRQEEIYRRLATRCRELHGSGVFQGLFDMAEVQQRYLAAVLDRGFRLPAGYLELAEKFHQVCAALAVAPPPLVPCHNDLLPENVIDDGEQLWLIDYEYSGMGDPCFEIGNIASESHFEPDAADQLAELYFGTPDPRLLARCRLQAICSQYGWTLWGVLQHHAGGLNLDLWPWTMDKFDRAASALTSDSLSHLLTLAAGCGP